VADFDPEESEPDPEPSHLEPDEFDPDSLGPEAPSVPDLSHQASEVNPETAQLFWSLVLVFNAALFLLSIGVMFALFQSQWTFGAQLFLAGAVLFVYGYYRYRRFRAE
jgi:hypothetical protein